MAIEKLLSQCVIHIMWYFYGIRMIAEKFLGVLNKFHT
jgi:hypothetical protein